MGLLLCALVAPRVHALSRKTGTFVLVHFVVARHRVGAPILVWAPVAVVFLLRVAVQLLALGMVLEAAFGIGPAAGAALVAAHAALGGYRGAVETDVGQAAIVLLGVGLLVAGLAEDGIEGIGAISAAPPLGPFEWYFVAAIWIFLPPGVCLAVDNWQRMSTAINAGTARSGFLLAVLPCVAAYAAIVAAGIGGDDRGDVLSTFRALMPEGLQAAADLMLAAAIMSSIDTYVMPLAASLGRRKAPLWRLRALAGLVVAVAATTAILLGDVLAGVVASFNSLVVFLPTVVASALLARPRPLAAVLSLNIGVGAALALGLADLDSAAILGFLGASRSTGRRTWARVGDADLRGVVAGDAHRRANDPCDRSEPGARERSSALNICASIRIRSSIPVRLVGDAGWSFGKLGWRGWCGRAMLRRGTMRTVSPAWRGPRSCACAPAADWRGHAAGLHRGGARPGDQAADQPGTDRGQDRHPLSTVVKHVQALAEGEAGSGSTSSVGLAKEGARPPIASSRRRGGRSPATSSHRYARRRPPRRLARDVPGRMRPRPVRDPPGLATAPCPRSPTLNGPASVRS